MPTTLNCSAYAKLVEENLTWLKLQERSLERDHIIAMLEHELKHFPMYVDGVRRTDIERGWILAPQVFICPNCEAHHFGTVDGKLECHGIYYDGCGWKGTWQDVERHIAALQQFKFVACHAGDSRAFSWLGDSRAFSWFLSETSLGEFLREHPDGRRAAVYELQYMPRTRELMDVCRHELAFIEKGPRVELRHGTSPSQVCSNCGAYRLTLHTPGPWKSGPVPTEISGEDQSH